MTTTRAAETVAVRPRATYVAGVAQVGAGLWMLSQPGMWSLGLTRKAHCGRMPGALM